jgi:4-diphosphocytidyl-2-C-methyl-D-erythritol kinase
VPKAEIFLEKHIPVAMGLGGGSSDAAATITSLNRLWDLRLSANELALVAAEVGSDVAFFIAGGTALASGRGEQISPMAQLPDTTVTLVCPNVEITDKTARLYSRLTPEHFSDGSRTDRMVENLNAGESVSDIQYNVFEEVAFDAFPGLAKLSDRLIAATGKVPHLSGAGPALYFLPSTKDEYQTVSDALQPCEARVYLVQTVDCGHLTPAPG